MPAVKIDRRLQDGRAIVAIAGDVDLAVEDELVFALRDAVDAARGGQVVVDLSETTFLDASGVRALLIGHQAATAAGSAFRVTGVVGMVRRVLAITRVLRLLTGEDGEDGAAA